MSVVINDPNATGTGPVTSAVSIDTAEISTAVVTRRRLVARRFLRWSLLWSTERFTLRSRQKERCTKSRASLPADCSRC